MHHLTGFSLFAKVLISESQVQYKGLEVLTDLLLELRQMPKKEHFKDDKQHTALTI